MAQIYKNIPVKPGVYADVTLIADMNNRGLGDQIKAWTERELPKCSHKKLPVSIQTFDKPRDDGSAVSLIQNGLYCPVCKRVYAQAAG